MAHADVYSTVSSVVPCAHMAWTDRSAPDLPWATYSGSDEAIWAGDARIGVVHRWTVEHDEKRRDRELEEALGDAIAEAFGGYDRDESWVDSEQCLMVTYDFSEIEGDFDG